MTNEEARNRLKMPYNDNPRLYYEALDVAIKALEQQPSEDCISREEALKAMCDNCPMYNCVCGCSSYRHIERMASVTPQPKMGKWIDVESLDSALWHECSECGETEFYATDYCPNCGAKMEVEE